MNEAARLKDCTRVDIPGNENQTSIAVTTYGTQSYYTFACLESIRQWKHDRHQFLVACHDASLLLEYYLRGCEEDGLIDHLIFTPNGCGHTMGVNRCFEKAEGDVFFNVANDILTGPCIVDDCAHKLRTNPQLGMIGWHWYNEGTFWQGEKVVSYQLRNPADPRLAPREVQNIKNARWYTGKFFEGIGGEYWLCLCNTSFFGIRRETWEKVGGFGTEYHHYWADDFLNYAVLDQKLDVSNFEVKWRNPSFFAEYQYSNVDVPDRRRHEDAVPLLPALDQAWEHLSGGLQPKERQLLYQIGRSLPEDSTVLNVGLWRGTSMFIFMEAAKNRRMEFIGVDCFDDPATAAMSAQPPVCMNEVIAYMQPFIGRQHGVSLIKANTLELAEFPQADVIFVDAGHTKECIENDIKLARRALRPGGTLIFHDYGHPSWPEVKKAVDAALPHVRSFETIAVVRG